MAKVALKYAKDPETKRMAQNIVDSQNKEIGEMQNWLKKHATKAKKRGGRTQPPSFSPVFGTHVPCSPGAIAPG